VAAEIRSVCSRMLTLGIGSGLDCDGQILVTHDLVGAFPWFTPSLWCPKSESENPFDLPPKSGWLRWRAGLESEWG